MQNTGLEHDAREALLARLADMPAYLEARLAGLSAEEAAAPGPDKGFSPVEHCWHLADLEREGYGVRIRRLRDEEDPLLPDFDGAQVARERQYRTLALAGGLQAFRAARRTNLELLRSLGSQAWRRCGRQDGVGPIKLDDLPRLMAEHDASHRAEIEAWQESLAR